jgi:uracil phosphoribosyltransferase
VATPLILSNPIVADKVRQLRDERTSNETFLRLAGEISRFVAYEALAHAEAFDRPYVIVPILRAGLGMSGAVQELVPNHRLCLLGLRRNEETLQPDIYLDGLPTDLAGSAVLLCDPMLATGGSLVFALDLLRARGAGEVTILCLIAAQAGLDHVTAIYPDVRVVAAALDPVLNEVGYITPGLGDAGDRLFGPPVR